MSSSSAPNPSVVPDTGSLSPQQIAKLDVSKLPHFMDFAETLRESLEDLIVPKRNGYYTSVHVLFLAWATDSGSRIKELEDLGYFLETELRFTTDYYQIPNTDAEDEFNSKLEDVVRAYGGTDELLIIYYAGNSRTNAITKTTTLQKDRIYSPALRWSAIEDRLNQTIATDSNILYILDSGYMPSERPSSSSGRKELLAATTDVPKSRKALEYQFTMDLLAELRKQVAKAGSVSVSSLYVHIGLRQDRDTNRSNIPMPYRLALSHKACSSSIVLCPFREYNPCTPCRLEHSQKVTLCMVQTKISDVNGPDTWWTECIEKCKAVQTGSIRVKPVDYVKRYEHLSFGGVHYILVSMPSVLSRKIIKLVTCGRAFTEFGTYGSEADITKEIRDAALSKARSSTTGRLGPVS